MAAHDIVMSAAGGSAAATYIEDVFSTYLYTGSSTTPQTITNGINLSGKGGLVWVKKRSAAGNNVLFDTARGGLSALYSNQTAAAEVGPLYGIDTSFNADGFTFNTGNFHDSGSNYASWTFRKQPKFFDVVTYTGDGVASPRAINHSLGSVPGCIMIKQTSGSGGNWYVYHAGTGNTSFLILNGTNAAFTGQTIWNSQTPSSTQFFMNNSTAINVAGETYVAYLFAHNAGGFGLTGTDNVISCGSFTTDATTGNATVNLGFEPQWVLTKMADGLSDWTVYDNMRGMSLTNSYELFPNSSSSEINYGSPDIFPSSTGFSISYVSGSGQYGKNKNIIYIAIRRGPMKVPTSGTSVFAPVAQNASTNSIVTTNFPTDLVISAQRSKINNSATEVFDRLRGSNRSLETNLTSPETSYASYGLQFTQSNTSYTDTFWNNGIGATDSIIYWNMRRAPSFFDEVCWTSDGTYTAQNHNLGVVPELVIQKIRNGVDGWYAYNGTQYGYLNTTAAFANFSRTLTSTTFQPITSSSGNTYVQYLFATCAGVSKVGNYTGNGNATGDTQNINCGFSAGARFVLIKCTSNAGDWIVFDTARGIVSGSDPWLLLNSAAAEGSSDELVPASNGFTVRTAASGKDINVSGRTYIYLAIA